MVKKQSKLNKLNTVEDLIDGNPNCERENTNPEEIIIDPKDAALDADLSYLKYGIEGKTELTRRGKLPGMIPDEDPQSYFLNLGMGRGYDNN